MSIDNILEESTIGLLTTSSIPIENEVTANVSETPVPEEITSEPQEQVSNEIDPPTQDEKKDIHPLTTRRMGKGKGKGPVVGRILASLPVLTPRRTRMQRKLLL